MAERGSVLMLMPAAVLVLIILGAITVDSAVVFLGQRQLANAVAAAANDAAGAAIADESFYTHRVIALDPSMAERQARAAFAAAFPAGSHGAIDVSSPPIVRVAGPQVCVRATATVRHIFARAIPGVAHEQAVTATARATAVRGGTLDPALC